MKCQAVIPRKVLPQSDIGIRTIIDGRAYDASMPSALVEARPIIG
jgi:hypothetical protein